MANKMKKWEKERLIKLTRKAIMHAIVYSPNYFAEDEKQTKELLEKWEKDEKLNT